MPTAIRFILLASTTLIVSTFATPASAAPAGSYLQTCRNIVTHYDHTLSAVCRTRDGYWRHSAINISRCDGDIANSNGRLMCVEDDGRHSRRGDRHGWHNDHDRGYYDYRHAPILSRWELVRSIGRQGYDDVHDFRRIEGTRDWQAVATWRGHRVLLRINPRTGRILAARYI